MRKHRISGLVLGLVVLAALGFLQALNARAVSSIQVDVNRGGSALTDASVTANPGAIIVDHTAVQQFDQIPDYWLDEARKLTIHYGHTSHGSQILSGLVFLEKVDGTKYSMSIQDEGNAQSGGVALPPGDRVPVSVAPGGDVTLRTTREGAWPYGYWWTSDAISGTKRVLSHDGGLFDVSGWAWCGQVSWCASYFNCENDQFIYDYFDAMEDLETTFPDMRFFYMTGHVVGLHANTARRNGIIRDYCANNGKVLFDFADIESWDLDGNYHPETTGSCEWCEDWCDDPNHADDIECQYEHELPPNSDICCGGAGCGNEYGCELMCAHSHGINCVIKGKAFWWMMARLAGWSGPGESRKAASATTATYGDVVTYTVVVQNLTAPLTATVNVTDVVPSDLAYVSSTLTATAGAIDATTPPTLTWTGELTPTPVVTLTYATTVSTAASGFVSNSAVIAAPGHQTITRTVAVLINPRRVYLPLAGTD